MTLSSDGSVITTVPLPVRMAREEQRLPRSGRLVTRVMWAPEAGDAVQAGVSRASARRIAGTMVVSRRASLDVPTPGGPRRRTLGSECLHPLHLWFCVAELMRAVRQAYCHVEVIASASRSGDDGVTVGPCPPLSVGKIWPRPTGTPPGVMRPAGHT